LIRIGPKSGTEFPLRPQSVWRAFRLCRFGEHTRTSSPSLISFLSKRGTRGTRGIKLKKSFCDGPECMFRFPRAKRRASGTSGTARAIGGQNIPDGFTQGPSPEGVWGGSRPRA
jgi:hypothetical protein